MSTQTKNMLLSWTKIFFTAVLTAFITIVSSTQSLPSTSEAWMGILIAGILAIGPVVLNWLNPKDPRYGRGYGTE